MTIFFLVSNDRMISSDRYIGKLYSSGWLQAVADNLTCAANVAKCVHCEGTQGMHIVLSLLHGIILVECWPICVQSRLLVGCSLVFVLRF